MRLPELMIACFLPTSGLANANDDAFQAARTVAHSWIGLMDDNKFEQGWDAASSLFQAGISRQNWHQALNAARAPLRPIKSGKPELSAYAETLTIMKEGDGSWRVAGYFVR